MLQQSLTPANIRASARREIGISEDQRSSEITMAGGYGQMVKANLSGLHVTSQQPRAAEQVAYLLKQF